MSFLAEPFVLVPTISFLLAIVIGRWWVLLLPAAAWLAFFVGSYYGWWGGLLRDYWYMAMLAQIGVGVAAVIAGLALRWLFFRAGRSHRAPTQTR